MAPFWGPKTAAASSKVVVTSVAITRSTTSNRSAEPMASRAPTPPSVVAEPPQPTMTRAAPASMAASTSWPTPVVVASSGSVPRGAANRSRPAAVAISITAVGISTSGGARKRHSASVGCPRGPDTVAVRTEPPKASSSPSPPSESGISSEVHPAAAAAAATEAATAGALAVWRNLSGAATMRLMACLFYSANGPSTAHLGAAPGALTRPARPGSMEAP